MVFFFKQKTAYEMRISDWSSDVCSSDLAAREQRVGLGTMLGRPAVQIVAGGLVGALECAAIAHIIDDRASPAFFGNLKLAPRAHERPQVCLLRILGQTREESRVIEIEERRIDPGKRRSEEHTSELQSTM